MAIDLFDITSTISGSIGDETYSRNAFGPFVRDRVIPSDPETFFQEEIREAFADASQEWRETLTEDERESWEIYAANVPLRNRLGVPRKVSGFNHWMRSRVADEESGLGAGRRAPDIFDLGEFTLPKANPFPQAQAVSVLFEESDAWVSEARSGMIVYASDPQPESINYYTGPYRRRLVIPGSPTNPPPNPSLAFIGKPIGPTDKIFMRYKVMRADNRVSYDIKDQAGVF